MICALAQFLVLAAASPTLLLNEILYDPPGGDGGYEFVELLCVGDGPCSLQGIRLEFINGSEPDRPRVLWSMEEFRQLAPGERWLLAEEELPGADVRLTLGLQNGPDALRLWREATLLDAVAWGPLEGVGEGAPADDVVSQALARVPDGHDSDDNARDFEGRPPSPGMANSHAQAVDIVAAELLPAWLARAGTAWLAIDLEAVGDLPRQKADLFVSVDDGAEERIPVEAPAGEPFRIERRVELGNGAHELGMRTLSPSSHVDSLLLPLQVGHSELILSEVLPAPTSPEPEWIELRLLDLGRRDWFVADSTSEPRAFEIPADLRAGSFLLLSEECAALAAFRSLPDSVNCLELAQGWIHLNNSSGEGSDFADRIRLFDARGAVVDEFAYGGRASVVNGRSYERTAAGDDWLLSSAAPTPGRSNEVASARLPDSGLAVSPEVFTPDGDGEGDVLHVVLRPGEALRRVESSIVDLAGETVFEFGDAADSGNYLRWSWTGRDMRGRELRWGAYVVLIRAQTLDGETRRWRALFALGRRS